MRTNSIPADIGQYVAYDPESGTLTWKAARSNISEGADAGSLCTRGYRHIKFRRRSYRAHRVAYFLHTGEQVPCGMIMDHVNHVKDDNAWSNLRIATFSQNNAYRKPVRRVLPVGVYPSGNRFQVLMSQDGNLKYHGTFDTPEAASEAYQAAFNAHHGTAWNIASLTAD